MDKHNAEVELFYQTHNYRRQLHSRHKATTNIGTPNYF